MKSIFRYFVTATFLLGGGIYAQNIDKAFGDYHIKTIGVKEGLPNSIVESVFIDSKNRLWFGTRLGLGYFDGRDLKLFQSNENFDGSNANCFYEDEVGRIFVGTRDGAAIIEGNDLRPVLMPDSLKSKGVVEFFKEHDGQTKVIGYYWTGYLDVDQVVDVHPWKSDAIRSYFSDHQNKWIGTNDGLYKISKNDTVLILDQGVNFSLVKDKYDNIWTNVWDKKIFRINNEGIDTILTDAIVTKFYIDHDDVLWASTFDRGLMKVEEHQKNINEIQLKFFDAENGFPISSMWTLTGDEEGNVWTGNFGGGFSVFKGESVINLSKKHGLPGNSLGQSLMDKNNNLWITSSDGLVQLDPNGRVLNVFKREDYPKLPNNKFYSIAQDDNGDIYSGLYADESAVLKVSQNGSAEVLLFNGGFSIDIDEQVFHIATDFTGVAIYDLTNNELIKYIITDTTIQKNRIILVERDGHLIHIKDGSSQFFTYNFKEDKLINQSDFKVNSGIKDITHFDLDHKGNLWLTGEGLYRVKSKESGALVLEDSIPQKDNFPGSYIQFCKFDEATKELMIITDDGLAFLNLEVYYTNGSIDIKTLNQSDGMITKDIDHVTKDGYGNYWISSTEGIYKYLPKHLKTKSIEPKLYLSGVKLFMKEVDWKDELAENQYKSIEMLYGIPQTPLFNYNQNHLTFEFKGVHLTLGDEVMYSTYLEGFDEGWSEPIKNDFITYSNLPHGSYQFKVKTSLDGEKWTAPLVYKFSITPPFWKTAWFIIICIFILGGLIVGFIHFRTKKLKASARKLENKVAERTNELKIAYENIEVKNNEILDSINYASRLQNAILPHPEKLRRYLPHHFIYYLPKDVVSGDFYFFDTIENQNEISLYLSVVDCTGHGVPGAIMSIVGSNGLKRCIHEFQLKKPGEILDRLSQIVIENFSQSDEKIRDGMDVSLIKLTFDKNNRKGKISAEWAGANNPLWIIRENSSEIEKISPNKQAVGYAEKMNNFTTHSVEFNEGDGFYLFSDGFQDQFGGEDIETSKKGGKKFKSVNFRKLIVSVNKEPLEQQKETLNNVFQQWKGDLEQVDDVCVIGVRL